MALPETSETAVSVIDPAVSLQYVRINHLDCHEKRWSFYAQLADLEAGRESAEAPSPSICQI